MTLRNCGHLALKWKAGLLIKWGWEANLFFSLGLILKSLVYLMIDLLCIIFLKFHFLFVFMLFSLRFCVHIISEKSFNSLPFWNVYFVQVEIKQRVIVKAESDITVAPNCEPSNTGDRVKCLKLKLGAKVVLTASLDVQDSY